MTDLGVLLCLIFHPVRNVSHFNFSSRESERNKLSKGDHKILVITDILVRQLCVIEGGCDLVCCYLESALNVYE